MLGVDLNTSAGTAFLAFGVAIVFLWGAIYATSIAAIAVWAVIAVVSFLALYFIGQRVFGYLKYGRSRKRRR